MKSLFNKYVWLQLILSILLLFGGSVIIAFAINNNTEVLENALNIVIAVILFLFGLFAILTAFIFETKKYVTLSLLYGSASIALGVFLCTKELVLLNYIIYLIAIFFIIVGAVELLKAIILTIKDRKQLALVAKNKGGAPREKKKNKKNDVVAEQQPEQPAQEQVQKPEQQEIKELDFTSNQIEQK